MTNLDKEKIVNRILQDPIFKRREKYSKLLLYLAECSQKQYLPSESDIAAQIYERNQDFDPTTDASVRVLMWKLRKKIDDYYKNKGKHDKVQLTIPKRQYSLELVEKSNKGKIIKQFLPFVSLVVIFALSILLLILFIKYREIKKTVPENTFNDNNNFIFRDFINDEKPTILAIGHIFTYCEYQDETNSFRIVRNRLINSEADLSTYMSEYNIPEKNIWLPTWEIVPKNTLRYLNRIQSIFPMTSRSSLSILSSLELEWSELLDHHIIYIGHFHNLGKLAQFYQSKYFYSFSQITDYSELKAKLAENMKNNPHPEENKVQTALNNQTDVLFSLYHQNTLNDSINNTYNFVYNKKTNYVKDYVILTKLLGPNSNNMLFIISFHQIGRLKVINMLADPVQIKKFEDQIRTLLPSMPNYFEMLIEVKGYKETAMEMNILHLYPAESQFYLDNENIKP